MKSSPLILTAVLAAALAGTPLSAEGNVKPAQNMDDRYPADGRLGTTLVEDLTSPSRHGDGLIFAWPEQNNETTIVLKHSYERGPVYQTLFRGVVTDDLSRCVGEYFHEAFEEQVRATKKRPIAEWVGQSEERMVGASVAVLPVLAALIEKAVTSGTGDAGNRGTARAYDLLRSLYARQPNAPVFRKVSFEDFGLMQSAWASCGQK